MTRVEWCSRQPDLLIDNCASGGRAHRLETCMRFSCPCSRKRYRVLPGPRRMGSDRQTQVAESLHSPSLRCGFGPAPWSPTRYVHAERKPGPATLCSDSELISTRDLARVEQAKAAVAEAKETRSTGTVTSIRSRPPQRQHPTNAPRVQSCTVRTWMPASLLAFRTRRCPLPRDLGELGGIDPARPYMVGGNIGRGPAHQNGRRCSPVVSCARSASCGCERPGSLIRSVLGRFPGPPGAGRL